MTLHKEDVFVSISVWYNIINYHEALKTLHFKAFSFSQGSCENDLRHTTKILLIPNLFLTIMALKKRPGISPRAIIF